MSGLMRLAPQEIMVNNDIHQLVPGYTEWSIVEYSGSHWQDRSVFLYYKNYVAEHLLHQKHAFVMETDHRRKFATLQEVVETYKQSSLIQSFETWNREKGIVGDEWCQERGTPITTISLTLPLDTVEALQKYLTTGSVDQWIVGLIQQQLRANITTLAEEKPTISKKKVRAST